MNAAFGCGVAVGDNEGVTVQVTLGVIGGVEDGVTETVGVTDGVTGINSASANFANTVELAS